MGKLSHISEITCLRSHNDLSAELGLEVLTLESHIALYEKLLRFPLLFVCHIEVANIILQVTCTLMPYMGTWRTTPYYIKTCYDPEAALLRVAKCAARPHSARPHTKGELLVSLKPVGALPFNGVRILSPVFGVHARLNTSGKGTGKGTVVWRCWV